MKPESVFPVLPSLTRLALGMTLWVLAAGATQATPITDQGAKGPRHWADNSTIDVYIPDDPNGLGRDASIGDGISSWNNDPTLQAHHISIKIHNGKPPKGAKHAVQVSYGKAAVLAGQTQVQLGTPSTEITSATIGLRSIEPSDHSKTTKDNMKKSATHEMGHVLGLDDSQDTSDVMFGVREQASPTISDGDHKEIKASYAFNDSNVNVVPTVTAAGVLFKYSYDVTWQSGTELALFQVDVNGAHLSSITPPAGWAVDDYILPPDVKMRDSVGESFVGFILADDTSYLGAAHPELEFSFLADRKPGDVGAFLNGDFQTTGPAAVVPEPASWAMALVGFAGVGAAGRIMRRRQRSVAG